MLIKLLLTFCFVSLTGVAGAMSQKFMTALNATSLSGKRHTILRCLLACGMGLLFLGMFWTLTGLISIAGCMVLTTLIVLGYLFHELAGAVSGFTLPPNEQRITAMSAMSGAMTATANRWPGLVLVILGFMNLVAMLFVFWMYPYRDPRAIVVIGLLHFVSGQIVSAALCIVFCWPIVTSEFVANDLRDSHLSGMFVMLFNQTAQLVLGALLIDEPLRAIARQYAWSLLDGRFVVALPMVTFLLVGIFPFFVGVYRRRAEEKRITNWDIEWLRLTCDILKLPASQVKDIAITAQLSTLDAELARSLTNNALRDFCETTLARMSTGGVGMTWTKRLLVGDLSTAEIDEIITSNYENLFEWDLRFRHFRKMLRLRNVMHQCHPDTLASFMVAQLETERGARPSEQVGSVMAGTLLTALSGSAGWIAANYGKAIVTAIQDAVRR